MTIVAFLLLPVQRIPRYKMLLETILKYTSQDHPDHADLSAALTSVLSVADVVNNRCAF